MKTRVRIPIIGRVNVGKSTLFNRLTRSRDAIVENTPGVTRDRKEGYCNLAGLPVTLIDTGGIDEQTGEAPAVEAQKQSLLAVGEADLVILLVDGRVGLLPGDEEIAARIRSLNKPILLVMNKIETSKQKDAGFEFMKLGFGKPLSISAEHALGIEELIESIAEKLKHASNYEFDIQPDDLQETRVSILGRPNVGKSSLVNALLGEERHIVTEVPGTTRDTVDSLIKRDGKIYRFIDTAGLKRIGRTRRKLDKLSVIMAMKSLEKAQVIVLLIDSSIGFTTQDARIAGYCVEKGRCLVIAANKWDLTDRTEDSYRKIVSNIRNDHPFIDWAPVLTISAKTNQRIFKLFDHIERVKTNMFQKITTSKLNKIIQDAQEYHPAARRSARYGPIKFYYATQIANMPLRFLVFTNTHEKIHFSYKRYIINQLRKGFDFGGCPVEIIFRHKREKRNFQRKD